MLLTFSYIFCKVCNNALNTTHSQLTGGSLSGCGGTLSLSDLYAVTSPRATAIFLSQVLSVKIFKKLKITLGVLWEDNGGSV